MELKSGPKSSEGRQNYILVTVPMNPGRSSQSQNVSNGLPILTLRNRLSALIVASEDFLSVLLKAFLQPYGVETRVVENSMDAVDLVASGASFDVIFIDVLPFLEGLEAIHQIRTMGVETMVVGMTALYTPFVVESLLIAGANEVLESPCTSDKLLPILRELDGQV